MDSQSFLLVLPLFLAACSNSPAPAGGGPSGPPAVDQPSNQADWIRRAEKLVQEKRPAEADTGVAGWHTRPLHLWVGVQSGCARLKLTSHHIVLRLSGVRCSCR